MNTVRSLVLAALLLAPAAAPAQTIRGVVLEDETGSPIAGAHVQLLAQETRSVAATETDRAGEFLLSPRRPGTFVLRLAHLGYASLDSVTLLARAGETIELELRMGRTAIPLEPLIVTTRRSARIAEFYERQQRGGFGRFLTREDIERHPAARASELVRTMPGVYVEPARAGTSLITMRGGMGRCLPTIYVDGIVVRQFPESGVDDFVHASSLEGVEVYTGFASAPSPIHAVGACGVVAFWTRSDAGKPWTWRRFGIAAGLAGLMFLLTR